MIALAWAGILGGFVPDVRQHIRSHAAPYPIVVYFHAAAFAGWLVFLTMQALLIRAHQRRLHAHLGIVGAMLAGSMAVLGPWAALVVDKIQLGTPAGDPSFLSVQLIDLVEFSGLALAALLLNTTPRAHKTLMLLATLSIIDAGFGRIVGTTLETRFGIHAWSFVGDVFLGGDLLMLAIGAYDLATRHRLYPAYVAGFLWILAGQTAATWLYLSPSWKSVALGLIRR